MSAINKLELTVAYTESVDGGYVGFLREIPGVASQGETLEELHKNLLDAMNTMFEYNKVSQQKDTYKTETLSFAC